MTVPSSLYLSGSRASRLKLEDSKIASQVKQRVFHGAETLAKLLILNWILKFDRLDVRTSRAIDAPPALHVVKE